ncbi:MAG: hypothetical protein A2Z16_04750 [Chloroflexi bacterium RBG_16_54_18]|nr:MAG: hypothetical protein A2Z16_04750 [Chloroflexi bacterium RBG_16_54_18]
MPASPIRLLLLADTHLGFDLPMRPRVERRRRGEDFFANFRTALQPALEGEVDLVVHGGDLLYRSRVPPALVEKALRPLVEVAQAGVPVYLVPGNHERSHIPLMLWGVHPHLHIFDRPRTFVCDVRGTRLSLSGFPFIRQIREAFKTSLIQTGYLQTTADIRFLCLHQTVAGAQVGPKNFTFRGGADVIRTSEIPADFRYLLCGHIHRAQVLTHDLSGRLLPAAVIYPGSVERTAFAERYEEKGTMLLEIDPGRSKKPAEEARFQPLPARPMFLLHLTERELGGKPIELYVKEVVARLPEDAVVSLRLEGAPEWVQGLSLSARLLRSIAPETMNISLAVRSDAA